MRVELLYAPGCSSFKKARHYLETVIAEEGLPVPVELIEEPGHTDGAPSVRIANVMHAAPILQHVEHLRDAICKQWRELTEKPMAGAT